MHSKLLLLLGPSGVGKTTIISKLRSLEDRFDYISPYITRTLRPGESDKIAVSKIEFRKMEAEGRFLAVNELYGTYYGTPRHLITTSFAAGRFPVLDWPVQQLSIMQKEFGDRMLSVYVEPPDVDELARRLNDGRDKEGARLKSALVELELLRNGVWQSSIDLRVVSCVGQQGEIARRIYDVYLSKVFGCRASRV